MNTYATVRKTYIKRNMHWQTQESGQWGKGIAAPIPPLTLEKKKRIIRKQQNK